MAVPLLVNDLITETIYCYDSFSRQVGENVAHHRVTSVVGAATDEAVAIARAGLHATAYKAWLSSRSSYRGVGIKLLGASGGPEQRSNNGAGGGTAGSIQLPLQISGLLQLRTSTSVIGTTGKRYNPRGRLYIPFPSDVWNTEEGGMTDAGKTQLEAILATFPFTTTIVGTGFSVGLTLVIKCLPGPLTSAPVTGANAPQAWATQKRRGEFGQTNPNPIF